MHKLNYYARYSCALVNRQYPNNNKLKKKLSSFFTLFFLGLFFINPTPVFSEQETLNTESLDKENIEEEINSSFGTKTERLVVTPSRFPQSIDKVASSVTIITEEEIDARREPNLLETLRNVESLQVIQSGGPGRTTGMFLRGASPSQTLIMLDGIPLNEANSGLFDFSDISSLDIGSVEIIRGPQSLMYGSDAMGGVINIISKKIDEEVKSELTFEAGTYNTQRYVGRVSGGNSLLRASGGVSFMESDNISVANRRSGNPENDPYDNLSAVTSIEADLPEDVEVKATVRYTRARTSLDTFDFERGLIDALYFAQRRDSVQSSMSISKEFDFWTPTLLLGVVYDDYDAADSDNEFNNYEFNSLLTSIQQQNLIKFTDDLRAMAGYTYKRTDGENKGLFDEKREVHGIFYEKQYSPVKETSVGAGIRYDHDTSFGDVTTYRFFLAQNVNELKSKLRASYGTSFRAPTFNDLYFPSFSNRDLSPEKSRGFDLGVTTNISNFTSDITFFKTDYRNLIAFDTETFMPENINRADVQGLETRFSWNAYEWFQPVVSYTYLDSENKATESMLPRRARHQGGFGILSQPIEKLRVNAFATYLANRKDSNGSSMDDYIVFSGTVMYEVIDGIEPFIRVQNLFNRDYEEIPGYGTLGASVFAGIQVRL